MFENDFGRDVQALGGRFFLTVLLARSLIGPYPELFSQLAFSGFFIEGFQTFFSFDDRMARATVLGIFLPPFYGSVFFGFFVFSVFVFFSIVVYVRTGNFKKQFYGFNTGLTVSIVSWKILTYIAS